MERIKNFILLLFVIFVIIIIYEIVGQNFLYKGELYFVHDVAHRMKPKSKPDINSDGIRSIVEADSFHKEDLNIILLGDSFIYGVRLPYNKSIPYLLETKARTLHPEKKINVANFGWISSSPLLSLQLLKDIGKKYNPDIVMLAIDMTDFHDDIKYSRFFEKTGIYRALDFIPITIVTFRKVILKLRLESLHEVIFGFPVRRFFITDKPLSDTQPSISYIRENIEKINEYSKKELGAKFMLLVLPRSYQYSDKESPNNWEKSEYQVLGPFAHEPFKYFEQIKNDVDYPIYSLLPDFQNSTIFPTVFDDDPHWNETGNHIAVDAIYKYCLKERYFD